MLEPSWQQNWVQSCIIFRSSFWNRFQGYLGSIFDAFWGLKSMLKLYLSWEVKKLEKLILAYTRAQLLMSQGCGKSMKIWFENDVNIDLQLNSNLEPILRGFGSQVGAKIEAKKHQKLIENSIEILMHFEVFIRRPGNPGNTVGWW